MSKMTAHTWRKLREQIDLGDPIKDVCDESDRGKDMSTPDEPILTPMERCVAAWWAGATPEERWSNVQSVYAESVLLGNDSVIFNEEGCTSWIFPGYDAEYIACYEREGLPAERMASFRRNGTHTVWNSRGEIISVG
jgi:hypothetical protein